MNRGLAVLPLCLALGMGACSETPVGPRRPTIGDEALLQRQVPSGGVGLVLNSLTGVRLPVVGRVTELTVDQAVINEIVLGNVVGGVVGLRVNGTITGVAVSALGTELVSEEFTSELGITPGSGGCRVVTLNLGPLQIDGLGLAGAEVNSVAVDGRGSGAVGSLLCALGSVVSGVTGGVTRAVEGILGALNRAIGRL